MFKPPWDNPQQSLVRGMMGAAARFGGNQEEIELQQQEATEVQINTLVRPKLFSISCINSARGILPRHSFDFS